MQQNSGTISITVGSNQIIGTGTTFTEDAVNGSLFYIFGIPQSFQIGQVISDVVLNLTEPVTGHAGVSMYGLTYAIPNGFSPMIGLSLPTGNQIAAQTRIINRDWGILDRELGFLG